MKELQYPFDAEYLNKKKKSIKRELLKDTSGFTPVKVAILGGGTTSNIKLMTELFLLDNKLLPEFYESEYNMYYEDGMFGNPVLDEFKPDIVYICTSIHNILNFPSVSDDAASIDEMIAGECARYTGIWDAIQSRYDCPVIQNNFELPSYRLLGNMDASDIHGRVNYISRLNSEFCARIRDRKNIYICDINYLSAQFGLDKWSDPFYYHMYKYAMSIDAIPLLAFNVSNIIKSLYGRNKKGLVLDMDNTLWGGVIGDDGVDNIAIGPEEPEGRVFTEFQTYLKELSTLGILLNVDSKNDRENAIAGLHHPDSVLSEDDMIVIKANWEPKDRNFTEIASTLDLLPESLVFVDDNPAERHIVTSQIPGVIAPELNEPYEYIRCIDGGGYFEVTGLSADDAGRNQMYKENAKRADLKASFADYGEYLKSLEMHGEIESFKPVYYARITQLTNKSNQFNLTTKRYTQTQIEALAEDDDHITLYGRLSDRFGDNGVVSVVIGRIEDAVCHMELWLMSCRVLKRDMEYAMMDALADECIKRGIKTIKGYYYPTAKNGMVKDFYKDMGFDLISEDENGNREWRFDIPDKYEKKNRYIETDRTDAQSDAN